MVSRLLLIALLATVVATAVLADPAYPKNVIVGARQPGDSLLQRETVQKGGSLWKIRRIKKTFVGDNVSAITQVRLLDQAKDGNGATASIIAGGPGYGYVTVHFESLRSRGIHFVVELYGK